MSRRRPKGELQFGSDSFLDVVANIVGILIILIVIAGLRVGQMPVVRPTKQPVDVVDVDVSPSPVLEVPSPTEEEISAPIEPSPVADLEPPAAPQREPIRPLEVPQDLVKMTKLLESEIAAIRSEEGTLEGQLTQANDLQSVLLERQQTIQSMMEHKSQELTAKRKQTAAIEADIDLARETLARLTQKVDELESIPPHIEKLEHKITPISRVVNGHEKHYRLEHNRVAEVPIEDLIGRLREQIERRRDWLAKAKQYNGQLGPVRGFNMQYTVKVETMSEMDALKSGYGGYRVSLSSWEIQPELDLQGETAEMAIKRGAMFYQSLLGTSSDTTLTFWVYPDSYGLYRKLQKFAHEHGYTVAGRPLPRGVPISGSPHGSRSAGQ